jgi:sarcosine oxidase/L-pipecolate oxidase
MSDCAYYTIRDTETPTDDFIISNHPRHKGLVVATGGSGHAFKFLPTLGIYVSQVLDGTLPENLVVKWRWGSSTAASKRSDITPLRTVPVHDLGELPGWESQFSPSAKL